MRGREESATKDRDDEDGGREGAVEGCCAHGERQGEQERGCHG
jgi:hypothetical protein